MYIEKTTTYLVDDVAHIRTARYLILVRAVHEAAEERPELRALVRSVGMRSIAHENGCLNEGTAKCYGEVLKLAGDYGNNGGPLIVSRRIWDRAQTVPLGLVELLRAGNEALHFKHWARKTFPVVSQ